MVFGADPAEGVKLVFKQEQRHSPDLVFGSGDAGEQTAIDPAYVYLEVDTGAAAVDWHLSVATPMDGVLDTDAVGLDCALRWDSNVYRFEVQRTRSAWQQAQACMLATHANWQNSRAARLAIRQGWQMARAAYGSVAASWSAANRHCAHQATRWQAAAAAGTCTVWRWQGARKAGCGTRVRYQSATLASSSRVWRWQGAEQLRLALGASWQMGVARSNQWVTGFGQGAFATHASHIRWQAGMQAPPGISLRPGSTPADGDMYTPPLGSAVHLIFCQAAHHTSALVFGLCRRGKANGNAPKFITPKLAMYTHIHEARATLWPQGDPLVLFDCSIETDADGYGWHLRASGPAQLMEQLAPRKDGTPVRVRVELCGLSWIFVVGLRQRSRQFGKHLVSFAASSPTCLLNAPHAKPIAFVNADQQTAQQLATAALEYSGVTLDWQVDDWVVPAQVWSHQGTPLSAVLRIVDAVGAVVQSHRTADTLIVQPRYTAMPWEWADAAPDVQLPIGYCITESMDEQRQPPYNAVYTSGTVAGQIRRTKRAGTAGDLEAPMATDALLTESIAHMQRARSILGTSGWQAKVGLSLPLDTATGAPGLLDVGSLIEIDDTGGAWRGMVRGVSIHAGSRPGVRQTIQVERHLHTEAA